MLALISQREAFSIDEFATNEQLNTTSQGLTCFSSLVAGSTYMAAQSQRLRFLPFR